MTRLFALCLILPTYLVDTCYYSGYDEAPTPTGPVPSCYDGIEVERNGLMVDQACSIQEAIELSESGDTIHIRYAGVYYDQLVIPPIDLSIIAHEEGTILDGSYHQGSVILLTNEERPQGHVVIQNLTITGGTAVTNDTDPDTYTEQHNGGGIHVKNVNLELDHCTVKANKARYGGGIYIFGFATSVDMNHTVVQDNLATESGGGIYIVDASMDLKNVIIHDNHAKLDSGGINLNFATFVSLEFTVLANNSCGMERCDGGVGMTCYATAMTVYNSILSNNTGNPDTDVGLVDVGSGSNPSCFWDITYSDIYDLHTRNIDLSEGEGNLDVMPVFSDYSEDQPTDFHLDATSPLIDMGDPYATDPDGSRSDMGAYGGFYGNAW